jgi:hypothetical protein
VVAAQNTPAFGRASAVSDLAPFLSAANGTLAREGFSDPDPMVRIGALDMLEGVQPNQIWPLASPLLSDPSRGVRIRSVSLLAESYRPQRTCTVYLPPVSLRAVHSIINGHSVGLRGAL